MSRTKGLMFDQERPVGATTPAATWTDQSRFANTCTFGAGAAAPAWVRQSQGNWATWFDVTEYIDITHSPSVNLTNDMTILLWFNADNIVGNKSIIAKGAGNDLFQQYHVQLSTNALYFLIADSTNTGYFLLLGAVGAYFARTWVFLACTLEGTTGRIYQQGAFDTSAATAGSRYINTNVVEVGIRNTHTQYPFKGYIDRVRFFNYALSAIKISQIFEAERRWYGV